MTRPRSAYDFHERPLIGNTSITIPIKGATTTTISLQLCNTISSTADELLVYWKTVEGILSPNIAPAVRSTNTKAKIMIGTPIKTSNGNDDTRSE